MLKRVIKFQLQTKIVVISKISNVGEEIIVVAHDVDILTLYTVTLNEPFFPLMRTFS